MARGVSAKQTGVCPGLSEWDGSQIVVVLEICFISNGVKVYIPARPPGEVGRTWDCDLHAFRSARVWWARS